MLLVRLAAALALSVAASVAAGEPAAVVVDGVELWTIRAPRAGFTPSQRAGDVRSNIVALAHDSRRSLDDVRELHTDDESILIVGRIDLFSVTAEDARLEGKPLAALFAERRRISLDAARRYRHSRSLPVLAQSLLLALAAIALAVVALALLRLAYQRARAALSSFLARTAHASRVGALVRALEHPLSLVATVALGASFLAAGAVVVLATASFALGLFPHTATLSAAAVAAASFAIRQVGAGIVAYLPNLMVLVAVFALTLLLVKIAAALARALRTGAITIPNFHRDWVDPTLGLVRAALILFALVVAFPYLPGGDSPALRGVSIFIGVLFSLGSGSAMGNVIAGIILTYMRPFQLGDRVKIADSVGDVTEKSMLVTRIRTIKNVEVIVPNSAILGAHIVNYSANARLDGLILSTTVTIGYDAPWRQVRDLLVNAALKTPHVLAQPAPFVFHTSLNDFHVSYEINAYTRDANAMAFIYSELHKNIQQEFNAAGVEIMSPTYLSLRDGNTVTIPEEQRPAGYVPPPFNVRTAAASAAGRAQT
ncbi:MAG: mechanosensitive ion channel family protein [Bryobacteraceae bacterium]|nr:mechanosensitive ion channel family protein [Bryobacteraceae bacterium]